MFLNGIYSKATRIMISEIEYGYIHQLLCGCTATVKEYLRKTENGFMDSLYHRYLALSQENEIREEVRDAVDSAVDALYESRMLAESHWLNCDFVNSGSIECEIFGEKVTASLYLTPKEISVTIESPFRACINRRLYSLAPVIFTEEPLPDSPANEDAICRIKSMVVREYFERKVMSPTC